MTVIKKYVEAIKEELEGAKDYAEKYVEYKAKGDMSKANKYKEMANDELRHATNIHGWAVEEIENISKVYTAPSEMLEKWNQEHKLYVEHAAWIKQMLAL